MHFKDFLNNVSKIKNLELPGEASQFKMVPPFRKELLNKVRDKIPFAKKAAILALFYPKNDETYLVLILRKTYKGVHSAQVGFPGGKLEANETLEQAAVRETFEEVGVPQNIITVIRDLTSVYIPPSNYNVYPFLGYTEETPNFIKQDEEVEAIIEVSLQDLLDDNSFITKNVETSYAVSIDVPAFKLQGFDVWGATAMMLSEVKDLLKQAL